MSGTKFSLNKRHDQSQRQGISEERARAFFRIALGFFLLSPYLIWLEAVSNWTLPEWPLFWSTVQSTLLQAGLSSMFACAVGFILFSAFEAQTQQGSKQKAELALLFPNLIPPLFLGLSLISLVKPFIEFPTGLLSVVLAHVLLNAGLVAIALDRLVQSKLAGLSEAAWALGSSRWRFWREIAWPYCRGDLACIFLFIFSLCFTSFSLPLMLGGARRSSMTLEVTVYELIRSEGRWDKAVLLAALQSFGLFALALLLPHSFWPKKSARSGLGFLAWRKGYAIVYVPALLLILGWLVGLLDGLKSFSEISTWSGFVSPLMESLLTSLIIGLSVGILSLVLFVCTSVSFPHRGLDRFLNGYLAPSPAITGFGFLLLPGEGEVWRLFRLVLALTLISFPLLYRWMVHAAIQSVQSQVIVARSLGANWGLIFKFVIWPQIAPAVMRTSGVAALWASGDFALSGILLEEGLSLPLLIDSYLGSYRLDMAQLLVVPLMILGLGLYGFFAGATHYVRR